LTAASRWSAEHLNIKANEVEAVRKGSLL